MKRPKSAADLNFMSGWRTGAYPPPGFAPFGGCDLGNGDFFGLYWPTGHENEEPIVCEMSHDDRTLMPSFSSYEKWLEWADANDWEWGEIEVDDEDFVLSHMEAATNAIKANQPQVAIPFLEKACKSLPDFGAPWALLASQRKRLGDLEGAEAAALKAAQLASWVFEGSEMQSLRLIRQDGPFAHDPLVRRRDLVCAKRGGVKENLLYDALRECIAEYREQGQYIPAITLLCNFGYAMEQETISFQERSGFVPAAWKAEYDELCLEGLGATRTLPS